MFGDDDDDNDNDDDDDDDDDNDDDINGDDGFINSTLIVLKSYRAAHQVIWSQWETLWFWNIRKLANNLNIGKWLPFSHFK